MILLVDYSAKYLAQSEKYLTQMGYEVLTANEPRDMIRKFATHYESLSAVFFDTERLKRDGVLYDMMAFLQRHFDMKREFFLEWYFIDAMEVHDRLIESSFRDTAA